MGYSAGEIKTHVERHTAIISEMTGLQKKADEEKRDFTADEDSQFQKLSDEAGALRKKVERMRSINEAEKTGESMRNHGIDKNDLPGSGIDGDEGERRSERNDGPELPSDRYARQDLALKGWSARIAGGRPTAEQRAAIKASGVGQRSGVIDLSLPSDLLRNRERRGLVTGNVQGAGALIAQGFVPRFERAMLAFGPMLSVAEVMVTSKGGEMPWPMGDDTSNEGEIVGETPDPEDADPSFSAIKLGAYLFTSKRVKASESMMQDSEIDLAGILGDMLGERLGRAINRKATLGTGNNQPRGFIAVAPVGKETASQTAIADTELIDLEHSIDPAYRGMGASYMAHDNIVAALRKLKGGDGQYYFKDDLATGSQTLNGYRFNVNQHMANAMTQSAKTLAFGLMQKVKIRLVGSVRMKRLNERYADTDEIGFLAFMRADVNVVTAGNPIKVLQQKTT